MLQGSRNGGVGMWLPSKPGVGRVGIASSSGITASLPVVVAIVPAARIAAIIVGFVPISRGSRFVASIVPSAIVSTIFTLGALRLSMSICT